MDIKATITLHLKDETWQFSQLLNGRPLDDVTREEITALIMDDLDDAVFCNKHDVVIEEE